MSVPYHTTTQPKTTIRLYDNLVATSTYADMYYSYTEEKGVGTKVPHYASLRKMGKLLPFTQWYQFSTVSTCSGSGWRIKQISPLHDYTWSPSGYMWNIPIVTTSNVDSLITDAGLDLDATAYVQEAASRVYSSGWDALTFAVEFRKTIDLVTGALSRLLKLLREARRLRLSGKTIAQVWLELRYGWRLLFYDMKDIQQAIQNIDDQRKRFKERAGGSYTSTRSFSSTFTSAAVTGTGTLYFEDQFEVSLRGSIIADIQPPKISLNPIVTAWESITFSFVIDWFINIGQWLAAMSFLTISREYQAAAGYQLTIDRRYASSSFSVRSGWTASYGCSLLGTTTIVSRSPASVPLLPTTILRLDVKKLIDILALIRQLR